MRARGVALVVCLAAATSANSKAQSNDASAQRPGSGASNPAGRDGGPRAEARELGEKGDAAFGAGRCDKAIDFWRKADEVFHAPTLLLRIARCEALLGRVVGATTTLERIVGDALPANAPPTWGDARTQAATELAAVRERIARIDVHLTGAEGRTASIEIDDVPAATTDGGARVDPGAHRVVVRVGDATAERRLTVSDGERRAIELKIILEVPQKQARTQRDAGLVLGGLGLAALGVGIGFGISALSTSGHLDDACGASRHNCPPSEQAAIDRVSAHSLVADFALGGGAALALTGTLLLLTDASGKKEQPRVRLQLARATVLEIAR